MAEFTLETGNPSDEFPVPVWKRDGTGFDGKLFHIYPSTYPSEWTSFGSY